MHSYMIAKNAHPAGGFLYNKKCNFLLYKKLLRPYTV